jgi:thiol peroxidase
MARQVTFQANPLMLVGRPINIGAPAPGFKVSSQELKEVGLADFAGKIKILTTFPSLDTPVCDLQVKEFNKKASGFGPEVAVVGISMDLPFAQKRFCETFEINNARVVSDYKTASFGINYGLLIKELNLLARSVLIVDKNNILRYVQIVPELTHAPDYADVIKNLEDIIAHPQAPAAQELASHCKPCEGGTPPMPKDKIEKLLAKYRGWELVEDKKLTKEFKFKDFVEAKYFLDLVSVISQEQGHHPTLTLMYNKLKITLTTHAAGGLTENDFIMAKIIDEVGGAL